VTRTLGAGFSAGGQVRFGTADHAFKGTLTAAWQRASGTGLSLTAHDDFSSAGDVPETSGVRNTIAAQEFGSDMTDYYRTRGFTLGIDAGERLGAHWRVALDHSQQSALAVHATPVTGRFQPAFPADSMTDWRATLSAFHAQAGAALGSTIELGGSLSVARSHYDGGARTGAVAWTGRVVLDAQIERPFGGDRLVLGTSAVAVAGPNAPAQDLAYFGGPVTGPGYGYHELGGVGGVTQRVEWRHPVWSFPVPLGRIGSMRSVLSVAPFVQGMWTVAGAAGGPAPAGWHDAAGLGLISFWDALRIDVARGLRNGRWTFSVDFSRDLWRIL
jgi:hypothetical protein